jgi:hypothetical protein
LRGRNLELVEHRSEAAGAGGVKLISKPKCRSLGYAISEDMALMIGLLFRTLAPMRSRDNMRTCPRGPESTPRARV